MIVSKTPLRCSFFGGGTDFKGYYENSKRGYGSVISTAIDKYVYVVVKKTFGDEIRVVCHENEKVFSVDEVQHDIIREAMKITGVVSGIDIICTADVPLNYRGVGLASSSALTVGVLNALYAFRGKSVPVEELARQACNIEIGKLGQRIGIQDQYAVAIGGFNRLYFHNGDKVDVKPVSIREENLKTLQDNLMLFYTGITRDSRSILEEQSLNMKDRMPTLDEIADMVDKADEYLAGGDNDSFGLLLDLTWQKKKQLAGGITNNKIDEMYRLAKTAGALGGKILGAGGGGFLLLYVPGEKQGAVEKILNEHKKIDFRFENQGSNIIFME